MPRYPHVARLKLVDYKVRILNSDQGTAATTRVMIDTYNGKRTWTTVGAGVDIIRASWIALVDSVEYGLYLAESDSQLTIETDQNVRY